MASGSQVPPGDRRRGAASKPWLHLDTPPEVDNILAMRVLVIEDQVKVGGVLVKLLEKWNIEASLARDCEEARAEIYGSAIDVVVADLVLEKETSLGLVAELRESDRYRSLPVVLVSGKAGKEDIVEASRLGINGFLAKPFEPTQLRKAILQAYKQRGQASRQQQIKEIWDKRTAQVEDVTSPLIVFAEPVQAAKDLLDPANRHAADYLIAAYASIDKCNQEQPNLGASYVIESRASDILVHLGKGAAMQWVKAIFLSCRCQGNAAVMSRILRINTGKALGLYLVYDHKSEVTDSQKQGLQKLGVKVVSRSAIVAKLDDLMSLHLRGKKPSGDSVERTEALSPKEIRGRISSDIEQMTTLPPLPQVFEKISTWSRDPKSDLMDWIPVIEVEPMVCATILRHANSAAVGFSGEITEVGRAVVLLGKQTVAGLVASESMRKAFTAVQEMGFNLEEFWLHNVSVGFAAHLLSLPVTADGGAGDGQSESLAGVGLDPESLEVIQSIDLPRRLRLEPWSPAFVAGSMHDIGKGVMAHSYPGLYPLLVEQLQSKDWSVPMLAVEEEVAGGLTHPVAGETLMRSWGLADQLGNTVLSHHEPGSEDGLTFLVAIADVVGQVLYPFPRTAAYPLAAAIEAGSLSEVKQFLPEGFYDQPLLSADDLVNLVKATRRRVREFVEESRGILD